MFIVGNINGQIVVMITKKYFTNVVSRLIDQYEMFNHLMTNQTSTQTTTGKNGSLRPYIPDIFLK